MKLYEAKKILKSNGYILESFIPRDKETYLMIAVNQFLKMENEEDWLSMFTKEELMQVFAQRSDLDDYLGEVPPSMFAEEMQDINLFTNCSEKAGF